MNFNIIIEIIHDSSIAYKFRSLYPTLELISSIKVQSVSFILIANNINKGSHVHQASIIILFLSILSGQQSRKCFSMNIISSDDGYDNLTVTCAQQCQNRNKQENFIHLIRIMKVYQYFSNILNQNQCINIIKMMDGKASYIFSTYFIINTLLVLAYPYLRLMTTAGDRSLQHEDQFGFTYQNSIIYTVLAMALIAYSRSTSNSQFFIDSMTVGKIGVACLLFFAKFDYCLYYILICLICWLVIPYPKFKGPNKFIHIKSQQQFDQILNKQIPYKDETSKFFHFKYRNKMMYFVEFYADWALPCIFAKQLWYNYSNLYETKNLKFLSVNVSKTPEIAKRFNINTSGFSKQLPTVMIIQDGQQDLRFPPVDKDNKVAKVAKYDYKILLRYFDLQSRYLQTRD